MVQKTLGVFTKRSEKLALVGIIDGVAVAFLQAFADVFSHALCLGGTAAFRRVTGFMFVPVFISAYGSPVFNGVAVSFRVYEFKPLSGRRPVLPVIVIQFLTIHYNKSTCVFPGVQHPHMWPSVGLGANVYTVVLAAGFFIAYAATDVKVEEWAATQLAVHIVLVVPA